VKQFRISNFGLRISNLTEETVRPFRIAKCLPDFAGQAGESRLWPPAILIAAFVLALFAVPPTAGAQRAGNMHRIGWLSPATAANGLPNLQALRSGLRELGHVEGQTITIEARWADGRSERLPQLAAEVVRLPVDVLCTAGTPASTAAKQATPTIPIVFANAAFPDQSGLVKSYPRPGGNATGVAFIGPEYGKRLECVKKSVAR